MTTAPLPDDAVGKPLRRETALSAGVDGNELSGALWHSPHRGIHRWVSSTADPTERVRAAALLLPPEGAISGWGALQMYGVSALDGFSPDGAWRLQVLLCLPPGRHMRDRPGIAVFRGRLPADDVTEVDGVPVATPVRACFDEMRRSRDLTEAVVVADASLKSGLVTVSDLTQYVRGHPGWPGVPTARRALELADGRAASPPETRTRMLWMLLAGLPRPEVNVPVYDASGNLLGIADLLDEEAGVVTEYDGSDHRRLARHTTDNLREELLENAGLIVVRVTSIDLYGEQRRTTWRMQEARRRGMSRPTAERRWRRG